ncbi:hypothetical protein TOPH_04625 [Tolypocladium ophioglossoides CBS 100239]|uniref:O-methyltransferase dimerisation domain-containing protein n=1 Tax=Tolypocladium ophioglossoides (strain CBS 100239) TaxID=1163406 RepID=A0A0L0N9G7_TOLOC|nr:hypothetical protein TOPH_04625 [Tolypocladium ophioglossoides CBS 100239]
MGAKQMPAADLDVLTTQLKLLLENPNVATQDDAQKLHLKQLARAASVALEQPFETLQRLLYSPVPLVTVRISQEHRIFATLTAAEEPVSFAALQEASGLELGVLESIMDYLCAQDMANEIESGKYAATKLSHMLTVPLFQDAVVHL